MSRDAPEAVLARATAVARQCSAELRLAAMVCEADAASERPDNFRPLAAVRAALMAARQEALEVQAAALRDSGVPSSVMVRWSHIEFAGYINAAREFAADLLVAAPRPSRQQRRGLGATDWKLIRRATCPVLLVRTAGPAYSRILVAVDPMHAHDRDASLDDRLVSLARQLCAPGGRVQLLHCHLPTEYLPMRAPGAQPAVFRSREGSLAAHRAALEKLMQRHGIAAADLRLEAADPREAIPDLASRDGVDLVIMGWVARSRLQRLLVGSTADAVMGRLPCDVLTVTPTATG